MPIAFGLRNSRDLYNKLIWEIEQLINCPPGPDSPVSYLAFNCAVTAWHIADWAWYDLTDKQKADLKQGARDLDLSNQAHFERLIRRKSEDLRICYVIAQRVKHHTLRPKVDDHAIRVSISVAPVSTLSRLGDSIDDLIIERAKVVIAGESRPALEVFEGARNFWSQFMNALDSPQS